VVSVVGGGCKGFGATFVFDIQGLVSLSARISLQQRDSRRIAKADRSQMSTLVDCLFWQVWSALE
jgi:hypothetical protein